MFCSKCGKEILQKQSFCGFCGNAVTSEEKELTFGPFGVSVCNGKYAIFTWKLNNITRVEFKGKAIKTITNSITGAGKDFNLEIPYKDILSVETGSTPIPLGLREVLTIKFKEKDSIREISICSGAGNIRQACDILKKNVNI